VATDETAVTPHVAHRIGFQPCRYTVYHNRPAMCRTLDCRHMVLRLGGANRHARRVRLQLSPVPRKGAELLHTLPQMNLTGRGSRA
jgi:hypothetical protein